MGIARTIKTLERRACDLRLFSEGKTMALTADELCRMTSDPGDLDERFNKIYVETCDAMRQLAERNPELAERNPELAEREMRWVRGKSVAENGTLDIGAPRRAKRRAA